jgi:hypothetical protein
MVRDRSLAPLIRLQLRDGLSAMHPRCRQKPADPISGFPGIANSGWKLQKKSPFRITFRVA